MGKTSNEIMEAKSRFNSSLDELIEIRAESRAREIIEEFTVESFPLKFDIDKVDFEGRVIRINRRLM